MADKAKGMRFSKFKTDSTKEEEGVWVDYESGFRVKIARIGNPKFKEFMLKKSKPHMRKLQSGNIDNDLADGLMKEAIARTILVDWEGLLDDQDQPIPFSQETALDLMKESNDFYQEIFQMANERELFQIEDLEGAKGN